MKQGSEDIVRTVVNSAKAGDMTAARINFPDRDREYRGRQIDPEGDEGNKKNTPTPSRAIVLEAQNHRNRPRHARCRVITSAGAVFSVD